MRVLREVWLAGKFLTRFKIQMKYKSGEFKSNKCKFNVEIRARHIADEIILFADTIKNNCKMRSIITFNANTRRFQLRYYRYGRKPTRSTSSIFKSSALFTTLILVKFSRQNIRSPLPLTSICMCI